MRMSPAWNEESGSNEPSSSRCSAPILNAMCSAMPNGRCPPKLAVNTRCVFCVTAVAGSATHCSASLLKLFTPNRLSGTQPPLASAHTMLPERVGHGIDSLQQAVRIDEHQLRHAAAAAEIERDVPVQRFAESVELAFQAADHAIQVDRGLAAEAVGEIVQVAIQVERRVPAEVRDQRVARLLVRNGLSTENVRRGPNSTPGRGRRIEIAQLLAVAVRIGSFEDRTRTPR